MLASVPLQRDRRKTVSQHFPKEDPEEKFSSYPRQLSSTTKQSFKQTLERGSRGRQRVSSICTTFCMWASPYISTMFRLSFNSKHRFIDKVLTAVRCTRQVVGSKQRCPQRMSYEREHIVIQSLQSHEMRWKLLSQNVMNHDTVDGKNPAPLTMPERSWYCYKKCISGIVSGAGFFPSTVLIL